MLIRRFIRQYFESAPQIWDAHYRQVPIERLLAEYVAIRRYLLANYFPSTRVAIGLSRDYRYLLTLLACMESGVVFVPLRIEWPQARIKQIREISGFQVLLTDGVIEEVISRALIGTTPDVELDSELPAVEPNQPLYCLFTSGTTGMPKGVLIRRASYENFLNWCEDYFRDIGEQDRLLNSTDYTFDVALAEVAVALTRRTAFYCSNFRDDFFTLLNELHELKISVIATVPNNFMMLLDQRWADRADLSSLRHALIAGARFPVALKQQFERFLPRTRIHNCYGPTEATIYCLVRELKGTEDEYVAEQTVSVGSPIPGCFPLIVDEESRPVGVLQRGELLMGGVQVMDSYINNPIATSNALVNIDGIDYYRTGDLAFYNDKRDFFITGRNDDTIKVSGQRVNLSDIDGYVQQLDFVKCCASIAVEDERRGASIVLYLVTIRPLDKQDIFSALKEVLPKHQLPQDVIILDSLPVNNSGKICKKTLQQTYQKDLGVRRN